MSVTHDLESDSFLFPCPHCKELCLVPRELIRCTIFRHAVFKRDFRFVNPHATREECEAWLRDGLVYGCAKPFTFDGVTVRKCGYI